MGHNFTHLHSKVFLFVSLFFFFRGEVCFVILISRNHVAFHVISDSDTGCLLSCHLRCLQEKEWTPSHKVHRFSSRLKKLCILIFHWEVMALPSLAVHRRHGENLLFHPFSESLTSMIPLLKFLEFFLPPQIEIIISGSHTLSFLSPLSPFLDESNGLASKAADSCLDLGPYEWTHHS